ncbi:MAG: hypothetical protein LBO75_04890 [Bifidobacteriaceae bacterium]|jgi:hypothetical protein|nr:hypothetical protein [Bifidobacteriaceae bacterium]
MQVGKPKFVSSVRSLIVASLTAAALVAGVGVAATARPAVVALASQAPAGVALTTESTGSAEVLGQGVVWGQPPLSGVASETGQKGWPSAIIKAVKAALKAIPKLWNLIKKAAVSTYKWFVNSVWPQIKNLAKAIAGAITASDVWEWIQSWF